MQSAHPFDALSLAPHPGTLLLTPCPGTKSADLAQSLEQLKQAGAVAVVTLMQAEELQRFEVQALPELCQQKGLQWFHFPITDDAAPEQAFADAWARDKQRVHELLDRGQTVALHCKGGSGRTGLVAAQILSERGFTEAEAFARVQALRPQSLKHQEQAEYVKRLFAQTTV